MFDGGNLLRIAVFFVWLLIDLLLLLLQPRRITHTPRATCGIRVQFSACHLNVSPTPLSTPSAPTQMLHYCQIINSTTRAYGQQRVCFPSSPFWQPPPPRSAGAFPFDFLVFCTLSLIIYWRTATTTSITFSLNAFQCNFALNENK